MSLMNHLGIRAAFWTGCATLALCTPALSQVETQTGTFTTPRHHRMQGTETHAAQPANAASPAPAPAAPATPPAAPPETVASATAPPSLLDKPAEPAKIDLASGNLTIQAENSSLVDILNRVKADSGMAVNGLSADQRIFGSYGPGDPQDVLFALLDGSGYNVVMLGRTETGTPKELSLSPRGAGGSTAGSSHGGRQQEQMTQDEDNDDESQQPPPPEPPGAPQPDPTPPQQNGVRTPQQMLQELQQMRQQQQLQMQQQQQQQSPPPEQP